MTGDRCHIYRFIFFVLVLANKPVISWSQNELSFSGKSLQVNKGSDLPPGEQNLFRSIQVVDSIKNSSGPGRHFSIVYSNTMIFINEQLQHADPSERKFIERFSFYFLEYFLDACDSFDKGNLPANSAWQSYFSQPQAQAWQLILCGVNTHINADMWRAMAFNFTENELRTHKRLFLVGQKSVGRVYRGFFDTIIANNNYLRFMNTFTMGLARFLGDRIVYKWRSRQMKLAILYHHNQKKFSSVLKRVNRKKQNNDRLILKARKNPSDKHNRLISYYN